MTKPAVPEAADGASPVENARIAIGRAGFVVFVGGLLAGLLAFALRQETISTHLLTASCGVMIMLPVVNVLAIFAEEIRRRDWGFVGIAAAVLVLLGFSVVQRVT
jgi:hypothetical protein